jgi:hypothetical protein
MSNPRGVRAVHRPDFSESRPREWIDNEMVGCQFEDVRHRKRLRQLLEQFSDRVGSATPWASQDWVNAKAAYRFFANERISEANILAGRFGSTRERFASNGKSLALILHDTMEFSYRHEDADPIGILKRILRFFLTFDEEWAGLRRPCVGLEFRRHLRRATVASRSWLDRT